MKLRYWGALLGVVAMGGCSSVQSTFMEVAPDYQALPEAAMREVAYAIESAVAEENREAVVEDRGGVIVSTPEVKQAVRTRAARHQLVSTFLDTGHAVEQANGRIKILRSREYSKSTPARARDRDALLIMSENNDRWVIYEGILKASELSPRALSGITHIFAAERVKTLKDYQKYETADGVITFKTP